MDFCDRLLYLRHDNEIYTDIVVSLLAGRDIGHLHVLCRLSVQSTVPRSRAEIRKLSGGYLRSGVYFVAGETSLSFFFCYQF